MSWKLRRARVCRDLDVECVFPIHVTSYTSHEGTPTSYALVRVYSADGREWSVFVHDKQASPRENDTSDDRRLMDRQIEEALMQLCEPLAEKTTRVHWHNLRVSDQMHSVVHASSGTVSIICPPPQRSLHDLLVQQRHSNHSSPKRSPKYRESTRLFIVYQLVACMGEQQHASPSPFNLSPHSFTVDDERNLLQLDLLPSFDAFTTSPTSTTVRCSRSLTQQWCAGEISNLEYLMAVNAAAGRSIASTTSHAVLPWVTDFSAPSTPLASSEHPSSHLRDLTMSKFRLTKGDDHVDRMYSHTGYHIPENLSDLSVAIYLARVLPRAHLQRVVRATFEPKEYPASLAKMATSSPDECIPELYLDASVFVSCHDDMASLTLPPWCATPDACVAYHRRVLESDDVSAQLHTWIDLNFGVHLNGPSAVRHKNVVHRGFIQVFQHAHPAKRVKTSGRSKQASPTQVDTLVVDENYFAVQIAKQCPTHYKGKRHPHHSSGVPKRSTSHASSAKSFGTRYASTLSPAYCVFPHTTDWPFAVGCMIAEVYLDRPLFSTDSVRDYVGLGAAFGRSFSVRKALPQLASVPPSIRHVVQDLVHPNPSIRAARAQSMHHDHTTSSCSNALCEGLFPSHFPVVLSYLKTVTVMNWVPKTLELVQSRQVPREGVHLVAHTIERFLAKSSPAQAAEALVLLVPTLSRLSLDKVTFEALVRTPIVTLLERVDDVAVKIYLVSSMEAPDRHGWLRVMWHHLGTTFLVTHVLPVLVTWLRTGSALLKHAIARTLGRWAHADFMGATVVSHEILTSVLTLIDVPLPRLPSPTPLHVSPSGVHLALVHICAGIHPWVIHAMVLPPLFRHALRAVAQVEAAESSLRSPATHLSPEKIDVHMTCKTIRQLVSLLPSNLAGYHIPATLALLAVPFIGEWVVITSLVHTVLRLGQVVGTDLTKLHLCAPLRQFLVQFPHAQFPTYMQQFQHLLGFEHFDTCLGLPWSMSKATPFKLPKVPVNEPPLPVAHLSAAIADTVAAACQQLARRPPPTRRPTLPHRWTTSSMSWPLKGDAVSSIELHGRVRSLASLAGGRWMAVSSGDGIVTLHRTSDMTLIWQRNFKWPVHTIIPLSREGCPLAHLIVVCDSQSVYVLDVDADVTTLPLWHWKRPAEPLMAIQVIGSADGHGAGHVAVATTDTVVAHSIDTLSYKKQPDNDGEWRLGATDSLNNTRTNAAIEWKLVDSGCVSCLGGLFGLIGVGTTSGHVDVVETLTGRLQCRWQAHPLANVVHLAQVSDSTFITVGSTDKQAILWRWPSCHPITYITNLPESIQGSQVHCAQRDRDETTWLVIGHGAKIAVQCIWPSPSTRKVQMTWKDVLPPKQVVQSVVVQRHTVALGSDTGGIHLCV
ncbi:hypothetical protein H310_03221 [Aphanomyces invadans]|uniref:BEACH domain-containing protein n=1 Tax=Aphanomyces invadans TaxID=157072 RepID=A0A024UIP6_9STRA|nr:hypothetical protein H310_03221 [Aphanomyces invadans]ETW05458.1 hypothetical protein H310_03221 [Aphanomyces invadans]|eukprot:XP_008865235.1 hypothetical protein H310_03221 [Aphanomyces invadans]